jgi:hypothetical protein
MNKMTDEEVAQYEKEVYQICVENGTPDKFPDINAECLSKLVDRNIIYEILKEKQIEKH